MDEGRAAGPRLTSPHHHPTPAPLPQSSLPWMPYLAMSCVFAFILSFGIGPGEWEELLPLGLAEGARMSG